MKINRNTISKLPDKGLVADWAQSSRNEYAGVLILRYAPFLYGLFLGYARSAETAKKDVNQFAGDFPNLLSTYNDSGDFAKWLYRKATAYAHERHPQSDAAQKPQAKLLAAHRYFISNLNAEDEQAVALFEEGADKLTKPQRECIRYFFFERETFERIAGHAGYLTDKVRTYIEAGVVALSPSGGKPRREPVDFSAERFYGMYLDYVKGDRNGSDAYEIEYESMLDPFLSDAVNGVLGTQGDHAKTIAELDREIEAMFMQRRKSGVWKIALVIFAALAFVAALYFLVSRPSGGGGVNTVTQSSYTPEESPGLPEEGSVYEEELAGHDEGDVVEDDAERIVNEFGEATVAEPDNSSAGQSGHSRDEQTGALHPVKTGVSGEQAAESAGPVSIVSISEVPGSAGRGEPNYVSKPKIGKKRYDEYLRKAVVMPEDGAKGDVTLTFYVNRYGRPSQIRVTEFLSQDAHREAIRLLENGPEWSETDRQVTVVMRFE